MNKRDDEWDRLMSDSLKADLAHQVPSRRAERTEVDAALSRQRRESNNRGWALRPGLGRRIVIGATCFALLGSGLGVAAAASPSVRSALGWPPNTIVGISVAPGNTGVQDVFPDAGFRIVNPAYIPPELSVHRFASTTPYKPGALAVVAGNAPFAGSPPGFNALGSSGGVYEGFFSPGSGDKFVIVLQRPSSSAPSLPRGQPVSLAGGAGSIREEGSVTTVDLVVNESHVTVRTNLSRDEAIQVANSLK